MLGRTSKRLAAGVIVGLMAAAAAPTLAPAAMGQEQQDGEQEPLTLWNARRDVEFKGGSFREFIDELRDVWPEVNLVVTDEELNTISVPSISLRNVTIGDAIQVAHISMEREEGQRLRVSKPDNRGQSQLKGALITLNPQHPRLIPSREQQPKKSTHTWSVANLLLRDIDQEQMLTAIKTALELGDGEDVTLRLHPPTGLLIARGTAEQISTIDNVIDRLEDSAEATAEHAKPAGHEAFRDLEIQGLRNEVKETTQRLTQAAELIDELKKERDQLKSALLDLERRSARIEGAAQQAAMVRDRVQAIEEENRQLRRRVEEMARQLAEKDG